MSEARIEQLGRMDLEAEVRTLRYQVAALTATLARLELHQSAYDRAELLADLCRRQAEQLAARGP